MCTGFPPNAQLPHSVPVSPFVPWLERLEGPFSSSFRLVRDVYLTALPTCAVQRRELLPARGGRRGLGAEKRTRPEVRANPKLCPTGKHLTSALLPTCFGEDSPTKID